MSHEIENREELLDETPRDLSQEERGWEYLQTYLDAEMPAGTELGEGEETPEPEAEEPSVAESVDESAEQPTSWLTRAKETALSAVDGAKSLLTRRVGIAAMTGVVAAGGLGAGSAFAAEKTPTAAHNTDTVAVAQHNVKPAEAAPKAAAPDQITQTADKMVKVASQDKADGVTDQDLHQNFYQLVKAFHDQGIDDPKILAYMGGTIWRETGMKYQPIPEIDGPQQAEALGYDGGANYYGRGYVQLTHKDNYEQVGHDIGMGDQLAKNPDLALHSDVAAKVMADFFKTHGVANDAKTGDFVDAREGVNGTDHAQEIADVAQQYYNALANK